MKAGGRGGDAVSLRLMMVLRMVLLRMVRGHADVRGVQRRDAWLAQVQRGNARERRQLREERRRMGRLVSMPRSAHACNAPPRRKGRRKQPGSSMHIR